MKIPETSANVGAYYGNEENGQWQPNGVIIDSGVAGGVVGSGDGLHPQPVYPVHIPRGHIPGYVMAGAYYAGGYPAPADDFADYLWMENEEEFDKQVMQQLEEEALMEQCIEAMLEDEQRERQRPVNGHSHPHPHPHPHPTTSNGAPAVSLQEAVSRSTLNPLAAEFVPTRARCAPTEEKTAPEVKEETQAPPAAEPAEPAPEPPAAPPQAEEPSPPEPPEVSAADVPPLDRRRDPKKDKTKEPRRPKGKPAAAKSDTKLQPKKELKPVKSETKADARETDDAPVVVGEVVKQAPAAPKPINYAAAARANKPKAKPAN